MKFKGIVLILLSCLLKIGYSQPLTSAEEKNIPQRVDPFRPVEFIADANNSTSVPILQKTGKDNRISLRFQKTKLATALQLFADFTGINIAVSDKVSGNITLRLNDISCEQALDIILTTKALSKRNIGNVMLVAPTAEILNYEKKKISGESDLKKWAPLSSELLPINYAKAGDIAIMLKDHTSPRGSLSVDSRTNSLWLQDTENHLTKIKKLLKELDVPIKQVLIEARIVNVTKDFIRDLGIRFGVSRPIESKELAEKSLSLTERLNFDFSAMPLGGNPASIGIALAKLGNDVLLDLELSALESEGHGEIISSPKLITSNQQTAVIESGEEIPYQEITASGATSIAFKKAVLSLKVTPQITPDKTILMDLHINQDIPSVKIFNGVPSILTKEIKTTVLVNNGQTIVLGGIYKQNKYNAVNRIPFLGELPLLGQIFKNRSTTVRNEELLIFITPRIIRDSDTEKKRQALANTAIKLRKDQGVFN